MAVLSLLLLLLVPLPTYAEELGELRSNPFNPDSTSNPFTPSGSPFSNQSATNPFATDAPRLYDQEGNYRGN
jgi:hypothetical protein